MQNYTKYSFYSSLEKPIENMIFMYIHILSRVEKVCGIRVVPYDTEKYNGNVYLHIPQIIRIFCFRDWFNTRLDMEVRHDVFNSMMTLNKLKMFVNRDLKMNEIPNIDFDLIFLDLIRLREMNRGALERVDFWRVWKRDENKNRLYNK